MSTPFTAAERCIHTGAGAYGPLVIIASTARTVFFFPFSIVAVSSGVPEGGSGNVVADSKADFLPGDVLAECEGLATPSTQRLTTAVIVVFRIIVGLLSKRG
jgi:hypothetical protein